jgi:hypothetical protein
MRNTRLKRKIKQTKRHRKTTRKGGSGNIHMITVQNNGIDYTINDELIKAKVNDPSEKNFANPELYKLADPSTLIYDIVLTLSELQPYIDANELVYISIGGLPPPNMYNNANYVSHIIPNFIRVRDAGRRLTERGHEDTNFKATKVLCIAIDLFEDSFRYPPLANKNHTLVCINIKPYVEGIIQSLNELIQQRVSMNPNAGEQKYMALESMRINFTCIPTGYLVSHIVQMLNKPAANIMVCNYVRLINTKNDNLMLTNMLMMMLPISVYEWVPNTNLLLKSEGGKLPINMKEPVDYEYGYLNENADAWHFDFATTGMKPNALKNKINKLKQIYSLRSDLMLENNVNNLAHSLFTLRSIFVLNEPEY